jgi:SEC-C motif domain protein
MVDTSKCPCGSDKVYPDCCKKFHSGSEIPATAEILMRSRYAAYVKKLKQYLLDTWHSSTRPKAEELELNEESGFRWLSLKITGAEDGQEEDLKGTVSFTAKFKYGAQTGQMQELSSFVKEDQRWYYLDGA